MAGASPAGRCDAMSSPSDALSILVLLSDNAKKIPLVQCLSHFRHLGEWLLFGVGKKPTNSTFYEISARAAWPMVYYWYYAGQQ
jgi:hypothetical protein